MLLLSGRRKALDSKQGQVEPDGQSWASMESYNLPFPASCLPCMLLASHQGNFQLWLFHWKQLCSSRGFARDDADDDDDDDDDDDACT